MTAGPTQEERDKSFGRVHQYYGFYGEWERLERPADGALEFAVNKAWIARFLPPIGARVLDLGGGPGRYAIWLSQEGYRATLADLSPELLQLAREKAKEAKVELEDVVEANALDLSQFADASFDAALCMGPMYHLLEEADRAQASRELVRVLKPGAPVFVAFLNRLQALRVAINPDIPFFTPATFEFVRRWHEDGIFITPAVGLFTDAYFAHPREVASFMESAGVDTVDLIASECIVDAVQKDLASFAERQPKLLSWVMDKLVDLANEPSIVGNAGHLLYIGRTR